MYDVSRVEPRQLASGRFEEPSTGASLGTVTRLRINNDGSRIALLSALALPSAVAAAAAPATGGGSGAAASSGASTARASATGVAASAPAGAAAASAVPGAASAGTGAGAGAAAPSGGADDARVPDTRVHVYSVDSDRLTALDMGPRRYPVFLAWEPAEHRQLAVQTERLRGVTEASRGSTGLGGGEGSDGKGEGKDGEEDVGSGFKSPAGAASSDTNEEPDTEVATLFCTNNEVRRRAAAMLPLAWIRQSGQYPACRTSGCSRASVSLGLHGFCGARSLAQSVLLLEPTFPLLLLYPPLRTLPAPIFGSQRPSLSC